jgi:RHS repeat-associated protein
MVVICWKCGRRPGARTISSRATPTTPLSGQPQTVTDAAGQTTTLTYTAAGEVATVTNARGETTTSAYDGDGRLTRVTGPVSGATTSYTYDASGRVRTVTADEATVTTDDEVFDRPTVVTFPDGTTERTTYDRLDVATRTDRLGRVTRYLHDPLRRLVLVRDPAGRTIRQGYGPGGEQLLDANGHATTWERDLQGRVVREVRADGVTATQYTYEPASGRLATVTDPKGQVTTYTYGLDETVSTITFSQAVVATPGVAYTYDPIYPRVVTMTDGTGATAYTYHPAGQPGAGQVATVDGPLPNDTIAYSYDALGRVVGRTIDGAANALSVQYDALGRVTSETNALGTFGYGYDGASGRLATVTYPNGQTSAYTYLAATQDHRLATIHHRLPNTTTLSRFDYTYDAVGNILTWQQQAGAAAPARWTYGYDAADQLTRAVKATSEPTPLVLQRFAYAYDPAGNRLVEQIDDGVTAWTYDALNRLVAQAGGGVLQVEGRVDEPATVTIQGQAAPVSSAQTFTGPLAVVPGTNVFTIAATDASGNTATARYEVDVSDAPKTFTYDANGNLTGDGTRTFEWDARNQLVAVNVGTHRSEFVYDGLQRRVRMIEKENGATTSDTRVLWCETAICGERAADGTSVRRRAFGLGEPFGYAQGEQVAGQARFFTTDHLGSVREVTDPASTLLARYAFDPWGRRTVTAGSDVTTVGFTGHRTHTSSGLALTLYRGYDAGLGRWVSEDPIGLAGGINRFSYVRNRVVVRVDPLGLQECCGRKVTIWICERTIDAWYGSFLPTHKYVCCGGPNVGCFGHQRNNLRRGEAIPPEGNPTGTCRAVELCEDVKRRKCDNPASPCNASTTGWNCRDWAEWDGRSPCPDPYTDWNRHGGVCRRSCKTA